MFSKLKDQDKLKFIYFSNCLYINEYLIGIYKNSDKQKTSKFLKYHRGGFTSLVIIRIVLSLFQGMRINI